MLEAEKVKWSEERGGLKEERKRREEEGKRREEEVLRLQSEVSLISVNKDSIHCRKIRLLIMVISDAQPAGVQQ